MCNIVNTDTDTPSVFTDSDSDSDAACSVAGDYEEETERLSALECVECAAGRTV